MSDQPNYGFTAGEPASSAAPVSPGNGMAIAGFVLGLLAALTFLFAPISIILGILGIIFGALGMSKAKQLGGKFKGMAVSGLILGILGILLSISFVVWALSSKSDFDREFNKALRERHSMIAPASRDLHAPG